MRPLHRYLQSQCRARQPRGDLHRPCHRGGKSKHIGLVKIKIRANSGGHASADVLYTSTDLRGPVAIAMGTEDEGLTVFWMSNADMKVKIPMKGRVNSLNVSIATALFTYEAVRQRG